MYVVLLKLNTGVPNDWVEVKGHSVADLVQNCIDATYCPDMEGYLEVLEVKQREP